MPRVYLSERPFLDDRVTQQSPNRSFDLAPLKTSESITPTGGRPSQRDSHLLRGAHDLPGHVIRHPRAQAHLHRISIGEINTVIAHPAPEACFAHGFSEKLGVKPLYVSFAQVAFEEIQLARPNLVAAAHSKGARFGEQRRVTRRCNFGERMSFYFITHAPPNQPWWSRAIITP